MADTNDRHQGSDNDLFDETAPRSIFAATWFRAVLVLIVLGVIGAVAVPYILDAMNAPKSGTTAKLPTATPQPSKPPTPPAPVAVTPPPLPSAPPGPVAGTPATPPTAATPAPPPAPSGPIAATPAPTPPPTPPSLTDKPSDTKDAMVAATTPADPPKAEPKTKPAAAKTVVKAAKPAASGQWFVQVGAFKDAGTAKKVAAKLREDKYTVEESLRTGSATVAKATTTSAPPSSGGSDHYDVIITGQSSAEINKRLSAKGLAAEPVANGAVVKPSLPLRDAVALSKDLAVDGLKVQVRRAGGSATSTPKASSGTTASATGDSLHRVSVGGFPDRAAAMTALKELEAKGYKPFLTRR